MAYFADLTQYEYRPFQKQSRAGLLNVGWLDHEHDYPKGAVDSGSLEKLERLCASPVNRTRGVHHCPYCKEYPVRAITAEGRTLGLGNAEIRVPGLQGIEYAAPTLIYHYIREHEYRPPEEFLEALRRL